MKYYGEYVLGLDIAAVVSALIIFFWGNWSAEPVFVIATETIFILVLLAISFTLLYYVKIGKNNWYLILSLGILALGAGLAFMNWFIGGVVALIALLFLIISKEVSKGENIGILSSYVGFSILAIMPPLGALLSLKFSLGDYAVVATGIGLILYGIYLSLKAKRDVDIISTGFLMLSLSFLFLAPAHELLKIHSNGTYGIYDISIVTLSSITFFIFLINLILFYFGSMSTDKHVELGYRNLQKGNFEEALKHFQEAHKKDPKNEDVLNGLGIALMKLKRYDESEEYLRKLNQMYSNDSYLTNLGNLYFRKGDIERARKIYEQVLKNNPNFYNALNNLARCYMEKGEYEKAKELLEKAINTDENRKAAKINYYFLLTALGKSEEAEKYRGDLRKVLVE